MIARLSVVEIQDMEVTKGPNNSCTCTTRKVTVLQVCLFVFDGHAVHLTCLYFIKASSAGAI